MKFSWEFPVALAVPIFLFWGTLPAESMELCRTVNTVAYGEKVHELAQALEGLDLRDRNDHHIFLELSIETDLIEIRAHDIVGHPAGFFQIYLLQGGQNIVLGEAHWNPDFQRLGLTQNILRCLYEHAIAGAHLSIKSDSTATNLVLNAVAREIRVGPEYAALLQSSPHEVDLYLRRALTSHCQHELEKDSPSTPVWYRVLSKSGWNDISVSPAGEDAGLFIFLARKRSN